MNPSSSLSLLLWILPFSILFGQRDPADIYLNPGADDFGTLSNQAEQYFTGRDKGKGSGFNQWKRWEAFHKDRLTPDGKVTNVAARNWEEYHRYMRDWRQLHADNPLTYGEWHMIAPASFTVGQGATPGLGRVNVVAFHPTNGDIFWVGTPAGGLWRTNDGGLSWTPLTDGMPTIGISGIAVDYTNPDILYILTGDGDGNNTYSIGVLKTTNGGETWRSTGLSFSKINLVNGFKLIMHPTDPNILYAVMKTGLYRTTDGGLTWPLILPGLFFDLEFKPDDPEVMYLAGQSEFRRSCDNGLNWTCFSGGALPVGATRMAIGVSPANPDFVYLLAGPATGPGWFKGLYFSDDAGWSFSLRTLSPNILGYSSNGSDDRHQSGYDHALAVSRTDASHIMTGGINTWRNLVQGYLSYWENTSMWNNVGGAHYTHADIHDLAINPLNNKLYCASDGGLFVTADFGSNWTDISEGLSIMQFYRIAGIESNPTMILGGTQDNGTNLWTGGSSVLYMYGGDGFDCVIAQENPDVIFYTYADVVGQIVRSDNSYGWSLLIVTPQGAEGGWLSPLIKSPLSPTILYAGYNNGVFKNVFGGLFDWVNLGVGGASALAIGTDNPARIYAAQDYPYNTHTLYRTDNDGQSWVDIRSGLPPENITGIAVDPANSMHVFVTIAGFTPGYKVFYSETGGTTWSNISGTLPNVAVVCIVFDGGPGTPPNSTYIGTDIGVFYRNSVMGDWIPFMNGLPATGVRDLEINTTAGLIRAGTFGRGLWSSPRFSACPDYQVLTFANDPGNPSYTGYQYYDASVGIFSSRIITGGLGTDVTYKAGNYIKLTQGFNAKRFNRFRATLGPCQSPQPSVQQTTTSGRFE